MKILDWLGRKGKSAVHRLHLGRRLFMVYINNHLISTCISRRLRMAWYKHVMGFVVGNRSTILPDFRVSEPAKLVIGDHTVINNSCRFDNRRNITIGNNVSVSYDVLILTLGHDVDSPDFAIQGGDVTIEDYAWLCARCMIMPKVRIGKGAVVLPGSVVTKDVEPFSVVGGVPAKLIRKRREDLNYRQIYWDPRVPMLG